GWREDPTPLRALADRYATLPSGSGPDQNERAQADQRASAEAELFAALGRIRAPGARLVLRLARALIPQREIGKANYTQALDAARLAARALGSSLAADGRLSHGDDVFFLTVDNLFTDRPGDLRALVDERRAIRDEYLGYELPDRWTGPPVPIPTASAPAGAPGAPAAGNGSPVTGAPVTGVPVGGGPVTGRARVVLDPA